MFRLLKGAGISRFYTLQVQHLLDQHFNGRISRTLSPTELFSDILTLILQTQ